MCPEMATTNSAGGFEGGIISEGRGRGEGKREESLKVVLREN